MVELIKGVSSVRCIDLPAEHIDVKNTKKRWRISRIAYQLYNRFKIMKRKLSKAIENGDVVQARAILLELLKRRPGSTDTLESVTAAIEQMPGIFDKDDETPYPEASAQWDKGMCDALADDLTANFSRRKLRLYTEACVARYLAPKQAKAQSASDSSEKHDVVEEEVVEEVIVENVVVERVDEDVAEDGETVGKRGSIGKVIAYALMILGVAATIVGISIPIKFLIGLGIGVIMVGAAACYSVLSSNK